MSIRVLDWRLRGALVGTRLPFRFGIVEMRELVHAVLFATVDVDGVRQTGLAAENLAAKWFTKDPATSYAEDAREMLGVIEHACSAAVAAGPQPAVFDLWRVVELELRASAAAPLLAQLGVSFVERAAIDAFCRAKALPFARAVRTNALGMRLGELHPVLAGREPHELVPGQPLTRIVVRHTVGLGDTLAAGDDGPDPGDGLPASLEAAIAHSGLRRFKVKVGGPADIDRLGRVASVLEQGTGGDYRVTLDGNEQFQDIATLRAFWAELRSRRATAALAARVAYVEQPLPRHVTIDDEAASALAAWSDRPRLIVDESDDTLEAVERALACGYDGAAFKSCKGVLKGIANTCLLEHLRRQHPERGYVTSAEDLSTIAPVGLLADLAVIAVLGIDEPERNGQHYLRALPEMPPGVATELLREHGDLLAAGPGGRPALMIRDGAIDVGSVVAAPFGVAGGDELAGALEQGLAPLEDVVEALT